MPGSVFPRRGGCFEEAVRDLSVDPCHPGKAMLAQSVENGLMVSEKKPVFIVDIERLDLITTLPGCRANFWRKPGTAATHTGDQRDRFSPCFVQPERRRVDRYLKKMIDFAVER